MSREVSDGEGRGEGRTRQEGRQEEEEQGSQGELTQFDPELFFHQLIAGREHLMETPDVCIICTLPKADHDGPGVHHVFTPEGVRVDTAQFGPRRSERAREGDDTSRRISMHAGASQTPFDPVLRQALIDAGVITPQQLADAAQKVALITQAVVGNGGPPPQMWRGASERG